MRQYKVNRPFVDFGIYFAAGTYITDVSCVSNLDVKLWDGTLTLVLDGVPVDTKKKEEPQAVSEKSTTQSVTQKPAEVKTTLKTPKNPAPKKQTVVKITTTK